MPSDFQNRRVPPRRKTLADLLGKLEVGTSGKARSPYSTSPVAGPGRMRDNVRTTNRQSELQRRQQAAREALKRLRGE